MAVAVVVRSACITDVQLPWMPLVVDGRELGGGQLVSYCWSSIATVCADGDRSEPQTNVVRSSQPGEVQVRTKSGMRELHVGVTDSDPRKCRRARTRRQRRSIPAPAKPLALGAGTHYISVTARWERGDAYFLFALRVEPQ